MVFDGRPVVGFGRLDLVAERSQIFSLAITGNVHSPQAPSLLEPDAFVAGAAPAPAGVKGILSVGGHAQIGFAIVKTVVINMIDDFIIGGSAYLAVYVEPASFAPFEDCGNCIKSRGAFYGVPVALGKPEEIIRIDDSELAFGQSYPAEGIAVPKPPVQKHRLNGDPNQPKRYSDGEGKWNLAAPEGI